MNRGVSIPLRNTQFDRIRGVSCAVNRPRRRAYPKMSTFPQSLHKRNPLLCAGRIPGVLVGATLPAKKGQVYFGRFYLGKRRAPAPVRSHLSHENRRRFGSMRQIMNLPSTRAFRDNKPAGKALEHMRCGRPIKILPHTSAIQTNIAQNNRPFNAK